MNTQPPLLPLLFLALAPAAWAQTPAAAPRSGFSAGASVASSPATQPSATPLPPPAVAPAVPPPTAVALPAPTVPVTTVTTVTAAPAPAAGTPATTPPPIVVPPARKGISASGGGVLLNFQNASLNDVLTYLSEAAGFVVVQEAPVQGTVNIVSRQPVSADEAVDLLNTVLIEKGYTALRSGRILKIVTRANALKHPDLPVNSGSDPQLIPRKDAVVTQILPVRYGEAAKLVENLRPLLPETATIGANESSNTILMTDTQANIRRIAQIIQALDTSVAGISTITVFPLKFADSKEVATIITQLFSTTGSQPQGGQGGGGRGGRFGGFGGFAFGGGSPGGQPAGGAATSEARSASARVVAVADEQSNSVIVSSPEELVATIRQMINQIDTSITDVTDTRIFRLQNADAVELAGIINGLYGDTDGKQSNQRNNNGNQGRGGFGFPFGQPQPATPQQSGRSLLQSKVTAVGDPRTNSLLVTAAQETMTHIAEVIGRLDATNAKKQHVYTHVLQYSDPDNLANVLRGMLGQQVTATQTNRLTDRQNNGASNTTTDLSGTGSNGSGRNTNGR